tara:strand:+ start:1989 stop:3047 length:1059 start_codon:yes stop_codon:yes gene_type:complete
MIHNKIFSLAASIINFFIIYLFFLNAYAETVNKKYYEEEKGIVGIMYHRFNENKYPSTNIKMDIFKKHLELIKNNKFDFFNPGDLVDTFDAPKIQKKILITVDDGFTSFYENAWPYLKKNKIPFILFISTEAVGKKGYMNWNEIKEIEKEDFAFIGNHSHTHEYLIQFSYDHFKEDIDRSIRIFKQELGYNPIFFSYPFGEYSLDHETYISSKFEFAFGQHSGVIDLNKNRFELPRFPINEKYGDLKRFKNIINYLPLQYKNVSPRDKLIDEKNNPPNLVIEFFKEQKNLRNITCYSNEGDKWQSSEIRIENNLLKVNFVEKFNFRRGRINCSLNDKDGWRFFGIQFSKKLN